jgi:hypothetical protein
MFTIPPETPCIYIYIYRPDAVKTFVEQTGYFIYARCTALALVSLRVVLSTRDERHSSNLRVKKMPEC